MGLIKKLWVPRSGPPLRSHLAEPERVKVPLVNLREQKKHLMMMKCGGKWAPAGGREICPDNDSWVSTVSQQALLGSIYCCVKQALTSPLYTPTSSDGPLRISSTYSEHWAIRIEERCLRRCTSSISVSDNCVAGGQGDKGSGDCIYDLLRFKSSHPTPD